jgi:cbb3-type cytochrome oxidase subunit 1
MGIRFLKIAAVYLALGVSMGLAMGIMQNFALHPVHAHINLLGWATMALAGVIYVLFPAAATTRLAKIHFWIHNIALPVMMVALSLVLTGHEKALYALEPASTAMVVGLVLFVVNVVVNVRAADVQRVVDERGVTTRSLAAGAIAR